ncbi:MAG: DNA repair protein RecO [Candidatus Saccharimonadales bacterium]
MKINTISDSVFVLSRVNYGETDRILTVLSAGHGKLSVIAKGVRAGKSKLAGGIELFAENKLVLLKGKGDLYIVTSSRMEKYFGDIAKDIDVSTYVYECLKMINKLVPVGSGDEYYEPLKNLLEALDKNKIPLAQIKIWFGLKVLRNLGSTPNFITSYKSQDLPRDGKFEYDFDKHCFFENPRGIYFADHIKILRHLDKTTKPIEIKGAVGDTTEQTSHLVHLLIREHVQ